MEHVEIVHEDTGHSLGFTLTRAEAMAQKAWRRSTNIFVLNSEGKILCHQRALKKDSLPGYWMTHLGGHVAIGETYEGSALKELQEEAGISGIQPHQLIAWRTTPIAMSRFWAREYVILIDKDVSELNAQPGEVEQFAWLSPQEILSAAKNGENWIAGTHDFWTEYHCLRAVLAAAQVHGLTDLPEGTHMWKQEILPA